MKCEITEKNITISIKELIISNYKYLANIFGVWPADIV